MLRIYVYEDQEGLYRWQAWSGSRVVADSGEGYTRRRRCIAALNRYVALVKSGDYFIQGY